MRRERGFTLAEVLVVVAIVGILSAVAFPSMTKLLSTQGVRSASYDLFADLIFARSEAIARGAPVTVTGTSGTDYKQGWTITVGGTPIRTQAARSAGITFTASQNEFSFDRTGRSSASMTFSILPSDTSGAQDYMKRCIRLDPSGRPKTAEGACA